MANLPIILVLSEGEVLVTDIVKNIRKFAGDSNNEFTFVNQSCNILAYSLHLTTKYYETDLHLVPYDSDFSLLLEEIRSRVECLLVYFDSKKRNFLERITFYETFLKENGIQLGILLCGQLYDDSNKGITYKEIRKRGKLLDLIELDRAKVESADDIYNPIGYDELLLALRNFIWSNVKTEIGNQAEKGICKTSHRDNENCLEMESSLFEELLSEAIIFKNATLSLSRSERLAYAERFARKFQEFIGEELSSEDDE